MGAHTVSVKHDSHKVVQRPQITFPHSLLSMATTSAGRDGSITVTMVCIEIREECVDLPELVQSLHVPVVLRLYQVILGVVGVYPRSGRSGG